MLHLFPRLWHANGRSFIRRPNPIVTPRVRSFVPYDHQWRHVRRLLPGVWLSTRPWFFLDDFGFEEGKA